MFRPSVSPGCKEPFECVIHCTGDLTHRYVGLDVSLPAACQDLRVIKTRVVFAEQLYSDRLQIRKLESVE